MNTVNLFEVATRKKYRFPFRGQINIEDLWTLSLENLNVVYQALEAEAEHLPKKSLLKTSNDEHIDLENKIALVKYIAEVKQAEAQARQQAIADKERRQKILALIDEKENEALRGLSIEELRKLLGN